MTVFSKQFINTKLKQTGTKLVNSDKNLTIDISKDGNSKTIIELAEYLEILGSATRLAILQKIKTKPLDVQQITSTVNRRGDIHSSSRVSIKKNHMDRMLELGLVCKKPGVREDNRAVMQYSLVPGSVEAAIRTLNCFLQMNLNLDTDSRLKIQTVTDNLKSTTENIASVRVLGGEDEGHVFPLVKSEIYIGRKSDSKTKGYDPENDIVLSNSYKAVSRVSKPHAKLFRKDGQWYIQHCEGLNGTSLNGKKLVGSHKEPLKNGALICLAGMEKGVNLVFTFEHSKN
jgi:hypothetical protein